MNTAGLRWVLATGYLDLWNHVHDAEEELVLLRPVPDVVRGALTDADRIQGSTIPNSKQLLSILRQATAELSPEAAPYFDRLLGTIPAVPVAVEAQLDTTDRVALLLSSWVKWAARRLKPKPKLSPDSARAMEYTARAAIRYVRHTINEFRDSRWQELVRRRNRLLEAVVFTRITSYALLGLAILIRTLDRAIAAAAVYYLVGALVGLFTLLRSAPTSEAAVEDYGLASATLIQTTPFSGLAAIGGVVIVGLLGPVFTGNANTAAGNLQTIFDLGHDKFGIIIAALFGLTPGLLIARLQQSAQQFRLDLSSTEAHSTVEFPSERAPAPR